MNFDKFIHLVIVIVVVCITLCILFAIALPILGKMGIPSIQPYWLTSTVWFIFTQILLIVSILGFAFFILKINSYNIR